MNDPAQNLSALSCADDYDPNSMPVAKAREVIARFLSPVTAIERLGVRAALGRVLAEDIASPLDVPAPLLPVAAGLPPEHRAFPVRRTAVR